MKSIIRGTLAAAVVAGTTLAAMGPAAADCVRHFVNKSSTHWWKVLILDKARNTKAWFEIAPKTTQRMAWKSGIWFAGGKYGYISLMRYSKTAQGGFIDKVSYKKEFSVSDQADGDCVYINHSGNTGLADLNEPANGDLNLR